jgi:hypothetical protein
MTRRSEQLPIEFIGFGPNMAPHRGFPFIEIPCPTCGDKSTFGRTHDFGCVYGHHTRVDDVVFRCPREGCQRSANLVLYPGVRLSCGRHEFKVGDL